MEQNKTGKYLKYAIGEIVLVVIGILIALSVNNWNNNRTERLLEKQILKNLVIDLNNESKSLKRGVLDRFQRKMDGLLLGKEFFYGNYTVNDTANFISKVGYGGAFSRGSNIPISPTFQELMSTGNLKLIQNDSIRKDVLRYYSGRGFLKEYRNNLRTDFATYVNSLNPYNPQGETIVDSRDFKRTLSQFKTPEFLNLINQEITFGYSIKSRFERQNKLVKNLVIKIEDEMKK